MCEGLLEESDGEDEQGCAERPETDDGTDETSPNGPAGAEKRMEKKTEQQRRREKAARKLVSTPPCGLILPTYLLIQRRTLCTTFQAGSAARPSRGAGPSDRGVNKTIS